VTNTSFTYDGNNHYPTVAVSTDAQFGNRYVRICIMDEAKGVWTYSAGGSGIRPSVSYSLPFTWVPMASPTGSMYYVPMKEKGTYSLYYIVDVYDVESDGSTLMGLSPNFESGEVKCTVKIE